MIINWRIIKLSLIFIYSFGCIACGQKKNTYTSPAGYDLRHPEKFNMPGGLLEISGITFHKGNPDTLYAEQDEKGRLYRLHLGDKTAKYTHFGKDGDYEDLTISGNEVIVLRSDGTLFSFPFNESAGDHTDHVTEYKKIFPNGEYEGIYSDETDARVYVLCKDCKTAKKNNEVSGYTAGFKQSGYVVNGSFSIDFSGFPDVVKQKKFRFKPSALTRNPRTREWFILSSVNKMLVVADPGFKVKDIFRLDPALFPQPEGIAFDKDLNLYISNEGSGISAGNVLKFKLLK